MSEHTTGTAASDHAHHWLIDEPHGPVSRGFCKSCGKSREFYNFFTDTVPEDQRRSAA